MSVFPHNVANEDLVRSARQPHCVALWVRCCGGQLANAAGMFDLTHRGVEV